MEDFFTWQKNKTSICIVHKRLKCRHRMRFQRQNAFAVEAPPWTLLGSLQRSIHPN